MKNLILIPLILYSFIYSAQGQGYQSLFGDSVTLWTIYREIPDAGYTDSLFNNGDTLVQGISYKKLYRGVSSLNGASVVCVREDSSTGKSWAYYPDEQKEYLVMDLGMDLGDTFILKSNQFDQVVIVDSVYTLNGRKHIRFDYKLPFPDEYLMFIEGIGSNVGLLYREWRGQWYWADYQFLLCKSSDGIQQYWNQWFDSSCYVEWVGFADKNIETGLKIYPNPFSDHVTIETGFIQPVSYSVEFYNTLGELVLRQKGMNDSITIERGNLASGMYLVRIFDADGTVKSGRVAIE